MNSGVRDGYRYFFCPWVLNLQPLARLCACLREDWWFLAETAEIAEENNKSD